MLLSQRVLQKSMAMPNADTVEKGQITALDALVYLHTQLYGDEFTKETAENYLQINAEGWITRIMQKIQNMQDFS